MAVPPRMADTAVAIAIASLLLRFMAVPFLVVVDELILPGLLGLRVENVKPVPAYCRRSGRLSGPRKPNPCQRTLAGSGNVMLGKRSNSMGSRMPPTVRRDRCAPAQ